jgi:hypothetical protein
MRHSLFRPAEMAVLLAVALVIVPLLFYLPFWLPALVELMLLLRACLLLRQSRLPGLAVLLPLLVLAAAGVWLNLNTLIGREGGAALLILLLGFKVFESRQQRDWQVVLALGFFLSAIPLLFDQSPWSALWLVISLLALTWAMLRLAGDIPSGTARTAVQALLLSLPLMLVLFVVMPRLPGPCGACRTIAIPRRPACPTAWSPAVSASWYSAKMLHFPWCFPARHPPSARCIGAS